MPDPSTIAAQIAAIKSRFPATWHSDPAALADASSCWGGGCNDSGVFANGRYEQVGYRNKASCSVVIAESPNGLFTFGCRYHSPVEGFGYQPSVWAQPFATSEEARKAAVTELLAGIDKLQPPRTKAAQVERRDLCDQLRRQLLPRQQTLWS